MSPFEKLPATFFCPNDFSSVRKLETQYWEFYRIHWWRLFPYGCWLERAGSLVIFDRNYCPISRRSSADSSAVSINPLERIKIESQYFFYEDSCAPYQSRSTLPVILMIAESNNLEAEIVQRWKLSIFGLVHHDVWGPRWEA